MLYIINNKCYVNIAPSIYVEVAVSSNGDITPKDNKIEVNATTHIEPISLKDWLNRNVKNEPLHNDYEMDRRYNRRNK